MFEVKMWPKIFRLVYSVNNSLLSLRIRYCLLKILLFLHQVTFVAIDGKQQNLLGDDLIVFIRLHELDDADFLSVSFELLHRKVCNEQSRLNLRWIGSF